jgi:hypothetical protein
MYTRNLKAGKRGKATTKAGTGTWFVGLSATGSWIGIERIDGSKDGKKSTPDLFWNETSLSNGRGATAAMKASGND